MNTWEDVVSGGLAVFVSVKQFLPHVIQPTWTLAVCTEALPLTRKETLRFKSLIRNPINGIMNGWEMQVGVIFDT